MRAEDLKLEELVSFSDGVISFHGRRLILHDIHAMAQLRRDLVESLGLEPSRRVLCRFGYFWGEADAAALKCVMEWDSVEEWLRAGARLHGLEGVGRPEITALELHPDGRFEARVTWHDSAEAEEQLIALGASPDAGCWIQQGYASGYASFCLGRPVYFKHLTCRGRGDAICTAVGRDHESWGDSVEEIASHYEVDDIQAKVEELTEALRRQNRELAVERQRLREAQTTAAPSFAEFHSKAFHQVLNVAVRVARFDSSVLLTGESGVGKEVLARFIHQSSDRRKGPFVAINCGAIPEQLLESELFGHRAGSFTGATRNRAGLFEEAQSGTLLLDEIGDIPLALQVKLLQVLQEKTIRRVGENQTRSIDVRVIAATNRRLSEDVELGRFREDLFYRLRVVEINVPPLRERPEDILPLARFLTERIRKRLGLPRLALDPSSLDYLETCAWPGNVRELENAIERAAVMSEDGWIRPEHLPPGLKAAPDSAGRPAAVNCTLAEVERRHVLAVLDAAGGSRSRTAAILGISPATLWRKLKAWDVTH